MAACDMLYTGPGGLTSTEALVGNVPFIRLRRFPAARRATGSSFEKMA